MQFKSFNMQRFVIDIGNTSVKFAVYDDDKMIMFQRKNSPETEYITEIIKKYPEISSTVLSSVRDYPDEIDKLLTKHCYYLLLNGKTPLPYTNNYATPETLGKDRIAAVAAAVKQFPEENVLVIDAGTSITYDLVTKDGIYHGGGISPGIMMRFKALNTFTNKLPLITKVDDTPLIGNTTEGSIMSGVLNGVVAEVQGIIVNYKQHFKNLRIIISGGDYKYFDKKLKNSIFATPNIVMQGLKEILKFNEDN